MHYNDRDDNDINANLHNSGVSSGIGLLNIHNLPQDNYSSNLNYMNMSVENGGVNDGYCYMNSSTVSESKNHNYINCKNKIFEISPNIYVTENNLLPDGFGIDVMSLASALNQYVNM